MCVAGSKRQRFKAALEDIGAVATLSQCSTAHLAAALGLPHRRLSGGGGPPVPDDTPCPIVARRLVKSTEVGTRDHFARERWRVDAAIGERDAECSAALTTT